MKVKTNELKNILTLAMKCDSGTRRNGQPFETIVDFKDKFVYSFSANLGIKIPTTIDMNFCVNTLAFKQIVDRVATDEIELEIVADKLKVRAGKLKANTAIYNSDEVKKIASSVKADITNTLSENFVEGLKATCIIDNMSKLLGVYVQMLDNETNIWSSDKIRIACKKYEANNANKFDVYFYQNFVDIISSVAEKPISIGVQNEGNWVEVAFENDCKAYALRKSNNIFPVDLVYKTYNNLIDIEDSCKFNLTNEFVDSMKFISGFDNGVGNYAGKSAHIVIDNNNVSFEAKSNDVEIVETLTLEKETNFKADFIIPLFALTGTTDKSIASVKSVNNRIIFVIENEFTTIICNSLKTM